MLNAAKPLLLRSTIQEVKKLAAILLLLILAFNWYGYRLLSAYLEHQAAAEIEARLDLNHYNDEELIEFRVPLNLPYQTNWKEFERFDGEVEIDGVHYKYVKRKVEDGKLVVLCIPNETKMKLQTARDEFFKLVNDLSQPAKKGEKNSTGVFKSFTSEYWQSISEWTLTGPGTDIQHRYNTPEFNILSGILLCSEQPPDILV